MHSLANDIHALPELTKKRSWTVKMRCFHMQKIRGIVSGAEASGLIQKEVLILSDEERRSLLDKAGISSSIELRAAEALAIKAELAIPWNELTLCKKLDIRYRIFCVYFEFTH